MNKAISILLLAFVLLASSHAKVNLHFCGGQLATVEFFPKAEEQCGKCGMKKSKSCCQDVEKLFDAEDHSIKTFHVTFVPFTAILPSALFYSPATERHPLTPQTHPFKANTPPHRVLGSRYLIFHSFRV